MPSILLCLGPCGCRAAWRMCELKVMSERQCRGLTGMKPISYPVPKDLLTYYGLEHACIMPMAINWPVLILGLNNSQVQVRNSCLASAYRVLQWNEILGVCDDFPLSVKKAQFFSVFTLCRKSVLRNTCTVGLAAPHGKAVSNWHAYLPIWPNKTKH